MDLAQVFMGTMQDFLTRVVVFIPKLAMALVIWIVGKYLIRLGVKLLKGVEVPVKPVKRLLNSFVFIIEPVGKIFLFLVVLDYLGIGSSVISAVVSGLTFAIAIALGIAFGSALKDDAKAVVSSIKKELEK
jgi:small conductance mechanosensitive channel